MQNRLKVFILFIIYIALYTIVSKISKVESSPKVNYSTVIDQSMVVPYQFFLHVLPWFTILRSMYVMYIFNQGFSNVIFYQNRELLFFLLFRKSMESIKSCLTQKAAQDKDAGIGDHKLARWMSWTVGNSLRCIMKSDGFFINIICVYKIYYPPDSSPLIMCCITNLTMVV